MSYCPLCQSTQIQAVNSIKSNKLEIFLCDCCGLAFKSLKSHLTPEEEQKRYLNHENHILSPGYREFLQQLLQPALELPQVSSQIEILDFGSGPHPALRDILQERGFRCEIYDPFFSPARGPLEKQYDLIFCSEVAEHFRKPAQEWETLCQLLKPSGHLAVMTQLHTYFDQKNLQPWWYANDPTHVSFYHEKTWRWLELKYNLSPVFTKAPVFIFRSLR